MTSPRETLIEAAVQILVGDDMHAYLHNAEFYAEVQAVAQASARLLTDHPAEVIAALCECETCGGDGHDGYSDPDGEPNPNLCHTCGGSGVDGVRREAALRALKSLR